MTISYATARSAPILEWADERVLIEGWQQRKDRTALEKLLLSHVRIVFAWVRKLSTDRAEQEEMVSEGILGLIKAADMFVLARDVRFSTYVRKKGSRSNKVQTCLICWFATIPPPKNG